MEDIYIGGRSQVICVPIVAVTVHIYIYMFERDSICLGLIVWTNNGERILLWTRFDYIPHHIVIKGSKYGKLIKGFLGGWLFVKYSFSWGVVNIYCKLNWCWLLINKFDGWIRQMNVMKYTN